MLALTIITLFFILFTAYCHLKEVQRLNKLIESYKTESIKSLEIIRSYTENSMPNNTQLVVKSLCNREIERLKVLHKSP